MKISREVKTAVLVITGLIFLYFGVSYLKGKNILDSTRVLYAEYDNVGGLTASAPVTINGFSIGKVSRIYFKDDNSGRLVVEMDVNTEFKFSKNSIAELYQDGFIGGKAIAIIPANDNGPNAKGKDYLKGTNKAGITDMVNERLTPLQEKIEKVMSETDTLLVSVNAIFDEKTRGHLRASMATLETTISSFNKTSKSLNAMLDDNKLKLDNTISNFEGVSRNFNKISDSLSRVNIAATVQELQSTIKKFDNVLANIDKGEGSIGKLLKDEGLYNNLEGASKQMEQLLEDMKLNPKRYVHFSLFGKRQKIYDVEGNEIKKKD